CALFYYGSTYGVYW
nr:immunoglobulin heavy chain junction region [Mus musculus]